MLYCFHILQYKLFVASNKQLKCCLPKQCIALAISRWPTSAGRAGSAGKIHGKYKTKI